jgi:outer membrane biosynthesis protein TonB
LEGKQFKTNIKNNRIKVPRSKNNKRINSQQDEEGTPSRLKKKKKKKSNSPRNSNIEARRAAVASPCRTSEPTSFKVATKIIFPKALLITATATANTSRTATSKLSLILPKRGGSQREGREASFQAKMRRL